MVLLEITASEWMEPVLEPLNLVNTVFFKRDVHVYQVLLLLLDCRQTRYAVDYLNYSYCGLNRKCSSMGKRPFIFIVQNGMAYLIN